jgi:hypothetical protein
MIGNYQRGSISEHDRAAIARTLPPELNREKLWAELEPVIKEVRSVQQIVETLQLEIRDLELAKARLAPFDDAAAPDSAYKQHVAELREAVRYYADLAARPKIQKRFKRFRILRAWQAAGGSLTVSSPDNPDGVTKAQKRGRGKPGGPLIEYFRTALQIICGDELTPERVKSLLYRDYKKHLHFQSIGTSLKAAGTL